MKVFENFDDKVNFVDENNIFLGYDLEQDCCEHAGWFISNKPRKSIQRNKEFDLTNFRFDKKFFKSVKFKDDDEDKEGGMVIFKITDGEKELFIHLFNVHNGYYAHGFEFKTDDKLIMKDDL